MFQRILAVSIASFAAAESASAALLYSSAQPSVDEVVAFVPPNNLPFGAPTLLFDDAVILPAQNPGTFTEFVVTRVTIGVYREVGAPATSISLWTAEIGVNPDFNLYGLGELSSVNLGAHTGGSPVNEIVTFGDGVTPLGTFVGDTTWHFGGQVGIALGIGFSVASDLQGWSLAPNAVLGDNDPIYVAVYNTATHFQAPIGFGGGLPCVMQYTVEGYAVPAPSAAGVLALPMLLARRRRHH